MKSFRHCTLRYALDRISEIIYQKRYPDCPWLTKMANIMLDSMLKETDIGLEFGSGRSTIWFARRIAFLTSIEHNISWYNKINEIIKKNNIKNVELIYFSEQLNNIDDKYNNYIKAIDCFSNNSLDFALIDGIFRSACSLAAISKIRPGGFLIIDNINWYLPSNSRSPNSRTLTDGPGSKEWTAVCNAVKKWRCIWTSSGVTDTAFFIKPCY